MIRSLLSLLLLWPLLVAAAADTEAQTTEAATADADAPAVDVRRAPSWEPSPFSARYRVTYEGVPVTATGSRELRTGENGEFVFASRVSAFMAHMEESARFAQDEDGTLRPLSYSDRRSGLIGSRNRQLRFDWSVPQVVRSGDRDMVQELDGLVYDPVSWQLALQRDLSRGDYEIGDSFRYMVSNGGEPDEYLLRVVGKPSLNVPAGHFDTILLRRDHDSDRETWIWVSPEHDYLLVRFEHVDGRRLTLALDRIND